MDKKEALKIVKKNCNKLENLPTQFKKDKEIVLEAVKKDGFAFIYADESLQKDKKFILEVLKLDINAPRFADESLQKDREIILEGVKRWGILFLEYASDNLKRDKNFISKAKKFSKNVTLLRGDSKRYKSFFRYKLKMIDI